MGIYSGRLVANEKTVGQVLGPLAESTSGCFSAMSLEYYVCIEKNTYSALLLFTSFVNRHKHWARHARGEVDAAN